MALYDDDNMHLNFNGTQDNNNNTNKTASNQPGQQFYESVAAAPVNNAQDYGNELPERPPLPQQYADVSQYGDPGVQYSTSPNPYSEPINQYVNQNGYNDPYEQTRESVEQNRTGIFLNPFT